MITNKEVYDFLNEKFPISTAMDFDNPGFLIGDRNVEVKKVLVALDCDRTAVQKAVETGCSLIISHHPVIFNGMKSITENDLVYKIISNGISVISMHTNLDVGEGGVNDCLCEKVGLKNVDTYIAADGYALRRGETDGVSAQEFAQNLHKKLGGGVKYIDGGKPINRVLVCGGSGGEFLYELKNAQCDALLSADIKHNVLVDAVNLCLSVFDAGHYATEDVVVEPLASTIRAQFSVLDVITHHPDTISFT